MENISNQIALLVLSHVNSMSLNNKPNKNEFTVLAAIITRDSSGKLSVISLATGTKCIGKELDNSNKNGSFICDSHAEVLVKRAFTRYILKEIKKLIQKGANLDDSLLEYIHSDRSIVRNNEISPIFRMKSNWDIYLFISDNPCGDSSIYKRNDGKELFTGAKIINNVILREDCQQIGCVRTKSGRSTIEDKNRTTSMSCSDKLCRWIVLGLVGSLVSNIVEPIFLKGIVIGKDPLSNTTNQLEALQRSLINRVPSLINKIQLPEISVVDFFEYQYSKCNKEYHNFNNNTAVKLVGTSISYNWVKNVYDHVNVNSDVIESTNTRIKWQFEGSLETTIANTGLLQGTTKRSLESNKNTHITSRLCRQELSRLFSLVIKDLHSHLLNKYNYNLCHSISNYLSSHSNDIINDTTSFDKDNIDSCINLPYWMWKNINTAYQTKRKSFLESEIFHEWICDDRILTQSFLLNDDSD